MKENSEEGSVLGGADIDWLGSARQDSEADGHGIVGPTYFPALWKIGALTHFW